MRIEEVFKVNGVEFTDRNEANAYLADLELKRAEREARLRKAEEERKAKDETKKVLRKEIDDLVGKLNQLISDYTKTTNEELTFTTNYDANGKKIKVSNFSSYNDWFNDFFKF